VIALASLSARDRVDGLAALGLSLYLDDAGQLRARGPRLLLDAARLVLRQHKSAIIAHLRLASARCYDAPIEPATMEA
jgi:hypothetical protein